MQNEALPEALPPSFCVLHYPFCILHCIYSYLAGVELANPSPRRVKVLWHGIFVGGG